MDSKKKNNEKKSNGSFQKAIIDPRFASVHSDPRFQNPPKHKSKVTIDSRFNRMFTDTNFNSSSTRVDKRGKVKKEDSVAKNPLKHYYRLDEEKGKEVVESEDGGGEGEIGGLEKGEEEGEGEIAKVKKGRGNVGTEDEESDESGSDGEDLEEDEGVESEEEDESDGEIAKVKNVKAEVELSDSEMESDDDEDEEEDGVDEDEEDGVDEDSSSTGSEVEYLSEEENNLALVRF